MIMADVLKIFLIIAGFLVTFVCYWLLFQALAPRHVERAREAYDQRFRRVLLYGVLVGLPTTLFGLALANAAAAPVKLIGVAILCAVILIALMGSAGLALHIGARLPVARDEAEPWRRVLRGGAVLALCFLLPGIGWFVVLPLTLITGFGAAAVAYRKVATNTTVPAPADSFGNHS